MLNDQRLRVLETSEKPTHSHVWRVNGLDCPVCAKEFENAVRAREGVAEAELDFMGGILTILCTLESGCEDAMAELGREHGLEFRAFDEAPRGSTRSLIPQEAGIMLGAGALLLTALITGVSWLLIPSMMIAGWPVAVRAYRDTCQREITMNTLMLLAAVGAFGIGEWHEGAMVLFLFSIARWLERLSTERARHAIEALKEQLPAVAHVIEEEGHEFDIPANRLKVGAHIRIRPNEKLPLDGKVLGGRSNVDESKLTGESRPVAKDLGASVFAGTMNLEGTLTLEVTAESEATLFSRILHSVERAQSRKTRFQGSIEKFAAIYTPAVVLLALLIAIVPPLFFAGVALKWLYTALILLVIACPCALVLAAPVTLVSAMSAAARSGILLRGGDILEEVAGIRVAAFDKTGTLTVGEPEILDIIPIGGLSKEEIFTLAAALENPSDHPLARPFRQEASLEKRALPEVMDFAAVRGRGVEGRIQGRAYRLGSREWALARCPDWRGELPAVDGACVSVSLLCDEGGPLGLITLGDRIRDESCETIEQLRRLGIHEFVMLSGDRPETAREFGECLGMTQVHGVLTPEEKANKIESLIAEIGPTLMTGDGINDTPALAAATVGVAMGNRGSDAVLETSGVVLLHDNLKGLPLLLNISRHSRRIITQNIALAVGLKLAVFALSLGGYATLWMAVIADTGASVLVVLNGLRALIPPKI